MAVKLDLINGKLALELLDHKGNPWWYAVSIKRIAPKVVQLYLAKLGSLQDEQYTVRCAYELWSCTCPSFKFSHLSPHTCKHCDVGKQLLEIEATGIVKIPVAA